MRQVSLSTLLGGTRAHVPTGISLGIQPAPDLLVERAAAALAAGYRKIKLKIQRYRGAQHLRLEHPVGGDLSLNRRHSAHARMSRIEHDTGRRCQGAQRKKEASQR